MQIFDLVNSNHDLNYSARKLYNSSNPIKQLTVDLLLHKLLF